MTSLLTSLYLLSFKQIVSTHSSNVHCIKFSSKQKCCHCPYSKAKSEFFESRCDPCKQLWSWKRSVKYIEKLFKTYKLITISWELNKPLLLFFSNGTIVTIELSGSNNQLRKIEIDDSLNGKFLPCRVVDVIFIQKLIFISYVEPKLSVINTDRDSPSIRSKLLGRKVGKIFGFEQKISHIDLIGPGSKNIERKLSLNISGDYLLVWWCLLGEVWPWTPVAYSTDSINMLIYRLNNEIDFLCSVKVNGDLISACFSKCYFNKILTLEEVKNDTEVFVNVSAYEIIQNQCDHVFMSKLPIQGKIISWDWNSNDCLIIVDSNNLLLIYDLQKKSSLVKSLNFIPKQILWHPQDCMVLVISKNGHVQCFDSALTCIGLKFINDGFFSYNIIELGKNFEQNCSVQKVLWQKSYANDTCLFLLESELTTFVFMKFSLGCITGNNLSTTELISQYLKCNAVDEAILLLRSLNWFHANELHFQCLSKIANFLLRKPLDMQTQSGLELTLGTFYNSIDKLPKKFIKQYQHKVKHLSRRFFHHLLRFHQFRKAFLLATDLDSEDLFLDLSHVAKEKGENILAFVALHKANEMEDKQKVLFESASSNLTETSASDDDSSQNMDGNKTVLDVSTSRSLFMKSYDAEYNLSTAATPTLTKDWTDSSIKQNAQMSLFKEQPLNDLVYSYNNPPENMQYMKNFVPSCSNSQYFAGLTNCASLDQIHSTNLEGLSRDSNVRHDSSSISQLENLNNTINPILSEDRPTLAAKLKERIDNVSTKSNKIATDNDVEDSRIKLVHFGII